LVSRSHKTGTETEWTHAERVGRDLANKLGNLAYFTLQAFSDEANCLLDEHVDNKCATTLSI